MNMKKSQIIGLTTQITDGDRSAQHDIKRVIRTNYDIN